VLGYFASETVSATWYDGVTGVNVKGVWVPGLASGVVIRIIAPQPVKANELTNLPDGEHVSDYVRTWADTMSLTTRDGLKEADHILWDTKLYKVTQVDDREALGRYKRVTMKKVG